jgi:hypothetical protein
MIRRIIYFSLLVFNTVEVCSGQSYPTGYFSAPLDTPLVLAGSFGEIRSNHFHSGIDLSTGEQEGIPVKAAAEGYISRIKVASDGFGKALYITHPNGYVTVYGHLKRFSDAVDALVISTQYAQQKYEIELFPKSRDFKVNKGEIIAFSGNTGGTTGPHLHFEIRDQETEEPINPLNFGFRVQDNIPPSISHVRVFPVREAGIVGRTDSAITYEMQEMNGFFSLNTPDYVQAHGYLGIGFEAFDQMDLSSSRLGIYAAELHVDGNIVYSWRQDRFNFNDTRMVNAHTDYLSTLRDKLSIERFFRLPGNYLKIYADTTQTGYLEFTDDDSHDIKLVARDYNGNVTEFSFPILSYSTLSNEPYQPKPDGSVLVSNQKGLAIHKANLNVVIPAGALYEDIYYNDTESKSNTYLSSVFNVGNPYDALHIPITVAIKPQMKIPEHHAGKAVIVSIGEYGELISQGGEWKGEFLSAKCKNFGSFAIMLDTLPPAISKEYVPADMNTYRGAIVQIKITDELSGIQSYSGMIDGKWHLFEYDKKNSMLTADISKVTMNTEHPIEIIVTDERGNTGKWVSKFWY